MQRKQKISPFNKTTVFAGLIFFLYSISLYAQNHQQHHGHIPRHIAQSAVPNETGQSAFAAIQEIVELLSSDSNTDWRKIDINALHEHLIDMNELTLRAQARQQNIADGVTIVITGEGRTLKAIQTMVPAHAAMLNGANEESAWQAVAALTENGANLRVTSDNPEEIARIQALGFFGLMATGAHHQAHHLGIVRGEMLH